MKIYKGILIHRHQEGEHCFDVVDDGPFRSLHFNSLSIQSRMQRSDPARLVLEYTQAMMLALAFHPDPGRILMIGLGGGSQARFLLQHYPDCHIDAVEIEPSITLLARRFFALTENERLNVYHMALESFLEHLPEYSRYDLVLIDAFDASGPVQELFEHQLLATLRAHMSDNGVCAINQWKSDPLEYARLWQSIAIALDAPAYDITLTEDPENIVMLFPLQDIDGKRLIRQAKQLERQTGLKVKHHLNLLARLSVGDSD